MWCNLCRYGIYECLLNSSVYQILERAGLEVNLVNAQHVKGVPGRKKTDVKDCRWLQKLHSYGLLQASFRLKDEICVLRSYREDRVSIQSMLYLL